MAVKAVLFDLGGVMFFHIDVRLAEKIAKKENISVKKVFALIKQMTDVRDEGKMAPKEYWARINKGLGTKLSVAEGQKMHEQSFVLRKRLYSFAKRLSKKNTVGILSNMPQDLIKFIRRRWDLSFFSPQFISSDYKLIKPCREFYLLAAKKMKLKPSEIVFIDDKMRNVIGAKKAGLKAFQYKSLDACRRELSKLGIKI